MRFPSVDYEKPYDHACDMCEEQDCFGCEVMRGEDDE